MIGWKGSTAASLVLLCPLAYGFITSALWLEKDTLITATFVLLFHFLAVELLRKVPF